MVTSPSTIALDGPVGVGKTSLGRLLAQRLGYRFYDTGSMYRALTWLAVQQGIGLKDEEALSQLAARARFQVRPCWDGGGDRILIQGRDVTLEIRSCQVEEGVSLVAEVAGVRQALAARQRALARGGRVILAGRDIGTVVLPRAQLKVFLTASPQERAQRRFREMVGQGKNTSYDRVLADLMRRDRIDSERAHAPLRPAPDARLIDTEGLALEEVMARILGLIREVSCP